VSATDAAGNQSPKNLVSNWTVAFGDGQPYARFLAAPLGLVGTANPLFSTQVTTWSTR
jgi:hypothetical protein